jgi:hypothetical protein
MIYFIINKIKQEEQIMKNEKTPILVVTSDKWSRDSYVVFEDDEIINGCIPGEWIEEVYQDASEFDDEITREQIASGMEDDFFADNTDVDEFWPEYRILRTGDDYYTYTDDGMCSPIDEDDALEIMPAVREKRIQEWRDEQQKIANAEIVTPRTENVMEFFGAGDDEKNELADDKTVLRKYNNSLYVYEAQLGEPAQWRLLQNQPHLGTGTLKRPVGA